jgi:hypothetical protein
MRLVSSFAAGVVIGVGGAVVWAGWQMWLVVQDT